MAAMPGMPGTSIVGTQGGRPRAGRGPFHAVSERHTDRTGGPIGWAGSQKVGLGRGMAARARSAFSCGGTTRARFRFGTKGTKNTRGPRPFGRSAPRRYGVGFPFDHPSLGCCSRLPILTFHLDTDSEGAFCLNHLPWVRTYAAGYPPSSSFGGSASTDPRSVPRHLRPCEPSRARGPAWAPSAAGAGCVCMCITAAALRAEPCARAGVGALCGRRG